MPHVEILSRHALNRALLARQLLLKRETMPVVRAVERLVGLQAQQARPPFAGLWTRLVDFDRSELASALEACKLLRATFLRGTLHLITPKDFAQWRPELQPMLTAGSQSILRERLDTFDHQRVLDAARACFKTGPRTFTKLRDALVALFPDADERAMGYFARMHLPVASVPDPASEWSFSADAEFELIAPQRAAAVAGDAAPGSLVMRYLMAFGPASVADFQAWSGLKGSKPLFDAVRTNLCQFQDEKKRVLYDLPDAPRPSLETPAPVRFIAEFDNLVLAHADRTRIVSDEHRPRVVTKNLLVLGTFLVDGFVAGTWKCERKKGAATLRLQAFGRQTAMVRKALEQEGDPLLRFLEPEARDFIIQFVEE